MFKKGLLLALVALMALVALSGVSAQELVPIRLQLQWVAQSQFAGRRIWRR
jgi:hypothetical protein